MKFMELKNKTVIITGSTGKLGSSIALQLARKRCNCVCHYFQNEKKAEQLKNQITNAGGKACILRADLNSSSQIKKFIEAAFEFGRCSILVNSAALFFRQKLSEITSTDSMRLMNINFLAPILMSQYFVEQLSSDSRSSGVAKIVNISDIAGIRPWANYSVYCGSKAALIAATKSLAKELGPMVCVNSVAPGIVHWPGEMEEERRQKQIERIPLKRAAEAKEVANAVIALLENDYITGQVLCVDGGRSI